MLVKLEALLEKRNLAPSRPHAREMIAAGMVWVGGRPATGGAMMVPSDAEISVKEERPSEGWVSRGALKLDHALMVFSLSPEGAHCLDVGASTGGFTEVLLRRGARKVVAVDVGYGQLAWSLRTDPRVEVRERTNARLLVREDFPEAFDFITVDASFISLRSLLPPLEDLLAPEGQMILLVKPQFEAGRHRLGPGGVVRDPAIHEAILQEVLDFSSSSRRLRPRGLEPSPLKGPGGNVEFLLWLSPGAPGVDAQGVKSVVARAHRPGTNPCQERGETCLQSEA